MTDVRVLGCVGGGGQGLFTPVSPSNLQLRIVGKFEFPKADGVELSAVQWVGGQVLVAVDRKQKLYVLDPFHKNLQLLEVVDASMVNLLYHDRVWTSVSATRPLALCFSQ